VREEEQTKQQLSVVAQCLRYAQHENRAVNMERGERERGEREGAV